MAKNSVRDFDATAANNTDIQSVDIAENCAPSGINNAIRELMADMKDVSAGTIALESPSADSLTVTGDLTVDTNTLYVDSTNNAVGIGTTDPSSNTSTYYDDLVIKNDTSGTGAGISILSNSTNGFGGVEFRKADGTEVAKVYASNAGGQLGFETGGSERMRLTSDGSLGLGTSSITSGFKMEVAGDARFGDTYNDDAVELGWSAGGSVGFVQAYDRGASAFRDLQLNNAVTVTSSGNVGIGTSSPAELLNLAAGSPVLRFTATGDSNYHHLFSVSDDFYISADRNNTGSGNLIFRNGGTSERMRITSSGSLMSNTTTDVNYAQTSGNGNLVFRADTGSAAGSLILANNADRGWSMVYANKFAYSSGDDRRYINWHVNGSGLASIQLNSAGTQVEYNTGSDRRLKENIVDIDDGITRIKQLQPRKYNWVGTDFNAEGFIADEADGIVPEVVKGDANAVDEDGNPIYQQIEYSKFTPLLTAALQEAIAKIETLEAKVTALENA